MPPGRSAGVGGAGAGTGAGQRAHPVYWEPPDQRPRRASDDGREPASTALATARTSQVLTEKPRRAAASSTRALSCSGRRSVMRRVSPSSTSGAVSAAGGGGRLRRLGRGGRSDDEADVPAAEPHVDGAGRDLAGQLLGRMRQRAEQHQADRGLQRGGEPLRQGAGLLATGVGRGQQVPPELFDEGREIHDVTMTPLWRHTQARWRRGGVAEPPRGPGGRRAGCGHARSRCDRVRRARGPAPRRRPARAAGRRGGAAAGAGGGGRARPTRTWSPAPTPTGTR